MGKAYVFFAYNDSLPKDGPEAREELGAGVLQICSRLELNLERGRIHSTSVGHHANALNGVLEVDAMRPELFMWSGNRMNVIDQMTTEELVKAREMLERVIERRLEGRDKPHDPQQSMRDMLERQRAAAAHKKRC